MTQFDEEFLNTEQVASILHVSRRTVERYAKDGKLSRYRQKRRVLFKRSDVEKLDEEMNQPHLEVCK
jgi:excisionase family DNA binding protein